MGKPINIEQHVNDRYKEVLGAMSVNFIVPPVWYGLALSILETKSPMSMGMSADEYGKMVELLRERDIVDCYVFAGLNNEIESAEPIQLGYNTAHLLDYVEDMKICERLAAQWRDQCGEVKDKVVEQVLKEFSNVKPGKNNNDQLSIHN